MAAPVKVARQQTPPELSGTFRTLPPEPTPTRAGTLRNPASGTFRTLPPEPTPTRAGTLRNPPEPSGTCLRNLPFYTGTLRNLTGTCLRNLHQQTPELSGTLRNLPPEPAPATRTGTHRSLSGLKTPLACAVGEKTSELKLSSTCFSMFLHIFCGGFGNHRGSPTQLAALALAGGLLSRKCWVKTPCVDIRRWLTITQHGRLTGFRGLRV